MAAYHWVYDSCHLQADCQEPGSAPELYTRQLSIGYLYRLMGNENVCILPCYPVNSIEGIAMLESSASLAF